LNVEGPNMYHLWTYAYGKNLSGEILCGRPGSVKWVTYQKGDLLPPNAIEAGYLPGDGPLYIGRALSGEIGKINTEANRIHNLWCHGGGRQDTGEILCAVYSPIGIEYKFVPIFSVDGGSTGYLEKQLTIESGLSGSWKEVGSVTEISAKAVASLDQIFSVFSANLDTSIKSHMRQACSANYEKKTETTKIRVDLSKPSYIYQAVVSIRISNGTQIDMKSDAIIQKSQPIVETEFEVKM